MRSNQRAPPPQAGLLGANANDARSMEKKKKKGRTCSYQSGCQHEGRCEGASPGNTGMIVSVTAAVTQRPAMSHLFAAAAAAPHKENLLMRARRKWRAAAAPSLRRSKQTRRGRKEEDEGERGVSKVSIFHLSSASSLHRLFFPLHLSVTPRFRHQAHVSRTDVIYQGRAPPAAHPSLSSPSNTPA